jgi:hydroxymethylpyrimidine pyrophosphatase-like HAD family hydrolase
MGRGVQLILCTGRAMAAAERFRAAIGAEGPMVYYNGAEVVDMPAATMLSATLLDLEIADFCVDISRRLGIFFQVFFPALPGEAGETLMIEKEGPEADLYRRHTGLTPVLGDLKAALGAGRAPGCIKGMFIAGPDAQERIRPLVAERFGGRVYMARTSSTFLEIMAAGVSKGAGLRIAMEKRGLAAAEVLALGDEENDLPMFEVAGFSAAPANAKEKVLKAANTVTGSNAEDGPAIFLETFFSLDT